MEIFKLLSDSPIVKSFDVLEYKKWKDGRFYKLKIILRDESILFVRDYIDDKERNYSFQWQTYDSKLIVRWDNARHHKHISTYPNHKHVGGKVMESNEISLNDILRYIEQQENQTR